MRRSFALNCEAARSIGAHARVRYEMKLRVPKGARPGAAKIGWNMDTSTGPFTGGVVEIVG